VNGSIIINTGVGPAVFVAVFSGVGVGDFKPTKVGVKVKVSVGVTGVAVGMGVYVFVDVKTGVGVAAGPRGIPPTAQAKDRTAHKRTGNIFFMDLCPN